MLKYVEVVFETMECNQIHSFYPDEEVEVDDGGDDIWRDQRDLHDWAEERKNLDEPACCNGNNEIMKMFNQKCVICFQKSSVYAFRQCGHHCICEKCYENKVI